MIEQLLAQILALGGLIILSLLVHRLSRLDITLSCLLVGFAAGLAVPSIGFDTGLRAYSLQPLVFFVILPVLIFEAAWHLKPSVLRSWLVPVLLYATLGVLIATGVSAVLLYYGIGHPTGFPWLAALLAAAIMAATDPVAVVAKLRTSGAPEDLATLFEGESLFNDATVVVLFGIIIAFATGEMGAGNYLAVFARVFLGGVALGGVAGLVTVVLVRILAESAAARLVLVLSAFATFYSAEHLLHVSGIMAVMVCAIISRYALGRFDRAITEAVAGTWEWLGLYLNSLLFVIMGLVITTDMFFEQYLAMAIAIVAALLARLVSVGTISGLSRLLGKPIAWGWQLLLFWGGLRGAIAVALVLSLPTSLSYWWVVQSMVFGVVVFSLLVQGTTIGWLIRRFGENSGGGG